ncbi:unnamed protein product [Didymodactylos carnosus]|uniref:Uncharacterized protein n=1 Tax=Didymodactylos carnosus TaxID=1234261 RepID=A0A813YA03_9BILA|nr:unnamed protein product [Didymodactylos carnosus]CAF1199516.1 unnamed protein product [Didymodactylos carnosus]CAF3667373.1 unnamed protein product [Didymodactylos carnosus]CAF4009630.1 unnamed protein product [Didymodactylos carnosus]
MSQLPTHHHTVKRLQQHAFKSTSRPFLSRLPKIPQKIFSYSLAENFVDHSTNPLLSQLYKIESTNAAKKWPKGRFANYECTIRRKDAPEIKVKSNKYHPVIIKPRKQPIVTVKKPKVIDPTIQKQKQKQMKDQERIYDTLFAKTVKVCLIEILDFWIIMLERYQSSKIIEKQQIVPSEDTIQPSQQEIFTNIDFVNLNHVQSQFEIETSYASS